MDNITTILPQSSSVQCSPASVSSMADPAPPVLSPAACRQHHFPGNILRYSETLPESPPVLTLARHRGLCWCNAAECHRSTAAKAPRQPVPTVELSSLLAISGLSELSGSPERMLQLLFWQANAISDTLERALRHWRQQQTQKISTFDSVTRIKWHFQHRQLNCNQ